MHIQTASQQEQLRRTGHEPVCLMWTSTYMCLINQDCVTDAMIVVISQQLSMTVNTASEVHSMHCAA